MSWQILALVSVMTASVASLISRVLMKDDKSDPIGYGIIFQFGLGFTALLFSLLFNRFHLPDAQDVLIVFPISMFLWAAYTVLSLSATKLLGASEMTILLTSSSVISIILGTILLREPISLEMVFGTALILISIWIVSSDKLSFKSRKGVFLALSAAICAGAAVVNDAFILKTYESFSYTSIMSFLPGVALLFIFPKKFAHTLSKVDSVFIGRMTVLCIFYTVQAISYYLALQNGAAISQLAPIARSTVILTVILAAIFLGERTHLLKKLVAAMIMVVGVIVLG